jgi:hypothetical protein
MTANRPVNSDILCDSISQRFCKRTGQVKKVRDSLSKTKRKSGKDCLLYQGHDVTTAKWCVLGNASSYRNMSLSKLGAPHACSGRSFRILHG